MNIRSTTPVLKKFATSSTIVATAVLMTFSTNMTAYADRYDDQINSIKNQVSGYNKQASTLSQQADSLQNTINVYQAQLNSMQAQVNLSQAKYDQLVQQIADTIAKIEKNQRVLSQTLSDLYVNNEVSPVEMLASSKNIGDYLDQQEYRTSVRDRVEDSIKQIKKLRKSLEIKKTEVERVLADQQAQQTALSAKQSQINVLLDQTRSNEQNYRSLIGSGNAQIQSLENQQRAAYQAAASSVRSSGNFVSVGGSGSYPWGGMSNYYSGQADPWDLYYGQCTSYGAWKADREGYAVRKFNGLGNAYEWPSTTSGYTNQGSTPHVGDIAVAPISSFYGPVGHIMYIEAVNGNQITVSEYNFAGPAQYSVRNIDRYANGGWNSFTFITFPRR